MNHLNRNALKYIPGMRNKENKPATICLAYFSNKIIQITKLPNGNQLPETLLKKHDACSNDYASPGKATGFRYMGPEIPECTGREDM